MARCRLRPNCINNQVLPGLTDRIVQLVEREQAYRIRVNERALNADIRSRYLGQILGALLSAAALTTAVFFAYNGHPISGATIATTTIGVVGGLLYVKQRDMRRQQEQELGTAEGEQMELPLGE